MAQHMTKHGPPVTLDSGIQEKCCKSHMKKLGQLTNLQLIYSN